MRNKEYPFLYEMYCSNDVCPNSKNSFLFSSSQRCPVCNEPALLADDLILLSNEDAVRSEFANHVLSYSAKFTAVGNTPMINNTEVSKYVGVTDLKLKNEGLNPSGSFKDRGSVRAYAVNNFLYSSDFILGTVSTGNMALSTAYVGNKLGVPNFVVVHDSIAKSKLELLNNYSYLGLTTLFIVDGEYADFHEKVYGAKLKLRSLGINTCIELTDDPFRISGYSILFEELLISSKGNLPKFIILPSASGALFKVAHYTFTKLQRLGLIDSIPTLVAVQEFGADPITQAYLNNTTIRKIKMHNNTVASAINVSISRSGNEVLKSLANAHVCVSVTADEIKEAVKVLLRQKIYSEEAAGASVAAAKKLHDTGVIETSASTICVLTGDSLFTRQRFNHTLGCKVVHTTTEDLINSLIEVYSNV